MNSSTAQTADWLLQVEVSSDIIRQAAQETDLRLVDQVDQPDGLSIGPNTQRESLSIFEFKIFIIML